MAEKTHADRVVRSPTATVLLFVAYVTPLCAVVVWWPGPVGGARPSEALAIVCVGLVGLAVLVLLLGFVAPWLLDRRGEDRLARTWRRGALRAGPPAALLTVVGTLLRLPLGSLGLQLFVTALVSFFFVAPLVHARRRWSRG